MKRQILLTIGAAVLLTSSAHATQELLAKSIKEARVETARTAQQLEATLTSLNALSKQKEGDLKPAYNTFCSEITKTEAAAGWTRTRIQWMGGDGRKYFQDWQKTVDGIANESLRKKAQKRLDSVRKDYDKVEASLKVAGDKFKPFLSDLDDIKKALATDITAGGVKAIRGTVKKANWDHKFVDQSVNSSLKGMSKMEKSLSSQAQ